MLNMNKKIEKKVSSNLNNVNNANPSITTIMLEIYSYKGYVQGFISCKVPVNFLPVEQVEE